MIDNKNIDALKQKAKELPLSAGVYIMKDAGGKKIYIGKSKVLRNRVLSYFVDQQSHGAKTLKMVSMIHDFDYMLTDSDIEALALENRLIKLHMPKFNIKRKDDKSYPYIKISYGKNYSKLSFTRRRSADDARYFGPFSGAKIAISLIKTAQKTFSLAVCDKTFPRDIGKERACIYKEIGHCSAPCDNSVSAAEYKELVSKAVVFLRGSFGTIKKDFEEKMKAASEEMNFEIAAKYRDKIRFLDTLRQKQKVIGAPTDERDIIAVYSSETCSVISVFFVREGCIIDHEEMIFGAEQIIEEDDILALLCDFYEKREFVPSEIFLDFKFNDENDSCFKQYLREKCKYNVKISYPEKGERKKLCDMVRENAVEAANRFTIEAVKQNDTIIKLANILALEVVPGKIEAIDISNFGEDNITGGKISFIDGRFAKNNYRTFTIKSTVGQDDYGAVAEVVCRRFSHKDDIFPDLLLIDGGKNHVKTAMAELEKMGIFVPVFGMVKDEFHKTRALTTDKEEISIARQTAVFSFIYKIQDEVHRYTIGRMHTAKRKTVKKSILTDVKGIGAAKAKRLTAAFKTLKALKTATYDEFLSVKGITATDAANLVAFFEDFDN